MLQMANDSRTATVTVQFCTILSTILYSAVVGAVQLSSAPLVLSVTALRYSPERIQFHLASSL
jgi:hypothetical protein